MKSKNRGPATQQRIGHGWRAGGIARGTVRAHLLCGGGSDSW